MRHLYLALAILAATATVHTSAAATPVVSAHAADVAPADDDKGCGCSVPGGSSPTHAAFIASALGLALLLRRHL